MTDIKYCMVTSHTHKPILFDETPMRSGLYQWINVFNKGITENWQEIDFDNYDVIHYNWCISDTGIFQDVVEKCKNSSTKLVFNMDHTVDTFFTGNHIPLPIIKRLIFGADHYFAQGVYQQKFMEFLLQKDVPIIPHPVDTDLLHQIRSFERVDKAGVIYHWYELGRSIEIPYLVLDRLNKKKILLGYIPGSDRPMSATKNMYPTRQEDNTFASFIEKMNECKIILDPYPVRSWGRGTVESASLGIPTVCSNLVDGSHRCFPNTNCDPFDIKKINELTTKLLNDETFYQETADYAYEQSNYYSKANAKKRFLKMTNDVI